MAIATYDDSALTYDSSSAYDGAESPVPTPVPTPTPTPSVAAAGGIGGGVGLTGQIRKTVEFKPTKRQAKADEKERISRCVVLAAMLALMDD